uniref:MDHV1887 n=2 Tax=Homo sapiens TaxID=9606 RepID=Q6UWJ2_HUMAN|nr:MDHV1887 [Homo sapiens]
MMDHVESDQMAVIVLFSQLMVCFLLELAWYSEMYLCLRNCRVTGFGIERELVCRREVLEPCLVPSLPADVEVGPLPRGTGLSPARLPPTFLWICTRLLPSGGDGDLTV